MAPPVAVCRLAPRRALPEGRGRAPSQRGVARSFESTSRARSSFMGEGSAPSSSSSSAHEEARRIRTSSRRRPRRLRRRLGGALGDVGDDRVPSRRGGGGRRARRATGERIRVRVRDANRYFAVARSVGGDGVRRRAAASGRTQAVKLRPKRGGEPHVDDGLRQRRADDDVPWPSVPSTAALTAGVPPASVLLPAGAGGVAASSPPGFGGFTAASSGAPLAASVVAMERPTRARSSPRLGLAVGLDLGERHRAYEFFGVCARAHVRPPHVPRCSADAPGDAAYSSCDLSLVASWRKSRADSSRSDAAPSISTAPHSSSHRKYTSSTARTMFPRRYPHSRSRNSDCFSSGLSMGFETSSPPSTLSGRLPCRLPCRLPRRDEPEARSVTVAAAAAAVAVMSSLRRDARGIGSDGSPTRSRSTSSRGSVTRRCCADAFWNARSDAGLGCRARGAVGRLCAVNGARGAEDAIPCSSPRTDDSGSAASAGRGRRGESERSRDARRGDDPSFGKIRARTRRVGGRETRGGRTREERTSVVSRATIARWSARALARLALARVWRAATVATTGRSRARLRRRARR